MLAIVDDVAVGIVLVFCFIYFCQAVAVFQDAVNGLYFVAVVCFVQGKAVAIGIVAKELALQGLVFCIGYCFVFAITR